MRKVRTIRPARPQSSKARPGLFISFEGIEGSGKTTQSERLATSLAVLGYSVLLTREPGGTPCAERIRTILLEKQSTTPNQEVLTPECETALVMAARSQHVTHQILPALSKGMIVVCDRFTDSTLAYQGFGRKLNLEMLQSFNNFVTQGLDPDLTFLFDLPIKQGLTRRHQTKNLNRLDQESMAFYTRVRKGFVKLAAQFPKRMILINGQESPERIAASINHHVTRKLSKGILSQKKGRHRTSVSIS